MITARMLVRAALMLERVPDGTPGVRDMDAPCAGFTPGTPSGTNCDTDGHYLCRECENAPEHDPYDETPTIEYHAERGWIDITKPVVRLARHRLETGDFAMDGNRRWHGFRCRLYGCESYRLAQRELRRRRMARKRRRGWA